MPLLGRTADDPEAFVLRVYGKNGAAGMTSKSMAAQLADWFKPKDLNFTIKVIIDNPVIEQGCTFYSLTLRK